MVEHRIHWLYSLQRSKTSASSSSSKKKKKSWVYDTKLHLMMRLQYGDLGSVDYLFIVIIPWSTLSWSDSTCLVSIYGSNRCLKDDSYLIGPYATKTLQKQLYENCKYELTMNIIPLPLGNSKIGRQYH